MVSVCTIEWPALRSDPVLFLHGGPGYNSYSFATLAPRLEKNLNMIYFDQRGERAFGKAVDAGLLDGHSRSGHRGASPAFRHAENRFLLGHSFGGCSRWNMRLDTRSMVPRIVFVDGLSADTALDS